MADNFLERACGQQLQFVVMTGVGLIGYGKAGRVFHAPLIRSVDGLDLQKIVEHRGDAEVAELLADGAIDLVVIATPNDSHAPLAERALIAGKHVVVDKPFTVTSEEARRLIEVANARDRLLTVFHNRRWEGDFRTIQSLIERQAFGRLVSFEARFDRFRDVPRPGAWREGSAPGSGLLYDLGSHLIDQALVLFGPPRTITADVRNERGFGSDDAFDIWMDYATLKVTLRAGMLIRERTPRFTVRGTDGTFVTYAIDPQERALASGRRPGEAGWGTLPPEEWGTLYTSRGEERIETLPGSYQAFYGNVRDAITRGAALAVSAEQARMTIEIIESALESSREKRSVALS